MSASAKGSKIGIGITSASPSPSGFPAGAASFSPGWALPWDAGSFCAALEDSLRLHRHQPGTLTGLDRYLHQRSHGMIGSLLWLIRSAAISAVLDGTEKITRKSLDAVEADITSRSPRPPCT